MSFLTCGGAASILRFGLLTQELFRRVTKATISRRADDVFHLSKDASSVICRCMTSPKASSRAAISLLLLTALPLPVSVWRVDGVARLRMRLARPAAEGGRREALAPGRAQLPGLGVAVALRCESSIAIYTRSPALCVSAGAFKAKS